MCRFDLTLSLKYETFTRYTIMETSTTNISANNPAQPRINNIADVLFKSTKPIAIVNISIIEIPIEIRAAYFNRVLVFSR